MEHTKYIALIQDIIEKQKIILGADITILKARSVPAITITDEGTVTNVAGNPRQAVSLLIDAYVDLSGQIVKSTLLSVFAKHDVETDVE